MVQKRKQETGKKTLADLKPDDGLNIEVVDEKDNKKSAKKPESDLPLSKSALSILSTEDSPAASQVFLTEGLLDESEKEFYVRRRRQYLEDMTINNSSDIGMIHTVLMEEIIRERLFRKMLDPENASASLSDLMNECTERYRKALESLGATRDKRIRNRETQGISLADLAKIYADERKPNRDENKSKKEAEENCLEDEMNHMLGLQFGVIAEENPDVDLAEALGGEDD